MHAPSPKDDAAFTAEIDEMGRTGNADFSQFAFPEGFSFARFVFAGPVLMRGVSSAGEISFYEAQFRGPVDFGAVATEEELRPTVFGGSAVFVGTSFHELAFFGSAQFKARASFAWSRFRRGAYFGGYWLRDSAQVVPVTFGADADFRLARFGPGEFAKKPVALLLAGASIRGEANFAGCLVNGPASMEFMVFGADALFTEFMVDNAAGDWTLTGVRFEQPARVRFTGSNFSRARLERTDLSAVRLVAVTWPRRRDGSLAVWDELRMGTLEKAEPRDLLILGELYRQLKVNYEAAKKWDAAGDFHVGEMEARRVALRARWKLLTWCARHLSLLGLYYHLSRYGEDYKRSKPARHATPDDRATLAISSDVVGHQVLVTIDAEGILEP